MVFRLFRDYEDKVTVRMFLDDELETLKRNKHFSPIELEENSGEHELSNESFRLYYYPREKKYSDFLLVCFHIILDKLKDGRIFSKFDKNDKFLCETFR